MVSTSRFILIIFTKNGKAMLLIAVLVPWLSFFLRGKILSGILCLLLQITIIGWLPAALWAVASRLDGKNQTRVRRMERRMARWFELRLIRLFIYDYFFWGSIHKIINSWHGTDVKEHRFFVKLRTLVVMNNFYFTPFSGFQLPCSLRAKIIWPVW